MMTGNDDEDDQERGTERNSERDWKSVVPSASNPVDTGVAE